MVSVGKRDPSLLFMTEIRSHSLTVPIGASPGASRPMVPADERFTACLTTPGVPGSSGGAGTDGDAL